jgi:hypothetical protein
MRRTLNILAALFVAILGTSAFAWGDTGHRTVCEIAMRNLTPTAAARVRSLLRTHSTMLSANARYSGFGWACTYPDHIVPSQRRSEHFINFPRTQMAVTGPGCGAAAICVETAIAADLAILESPTASASDRAIALAFIGHWFGDIHQPLHISFEDDRGGNEINSHGLCTSSLHSTWDTCILQAQTVGANASVARVRALARRWNTAVSASDRSTWLLKTEPWQWAAESYETAIDPAVNYCTMAEGACRYSAAKLTFDGPPRQSVLIDSNYESMAMPIIQRRISQAGIRLARQLNRALDPSFHG